jgi:hypothetical protein
MGLIDRAKAKLTQAYRKYNKQEVPPELLEMTKIMGAFKPEEKTKPFELSM